MKILIIGPSWVGDMVMSQSLYTTLKQQYPEAIIDVLAPVWCKPILERMPEINQAIEMPLGHGAVDLKTRWQLGHKLKTNHYTHAYILPNSAKSALIPLFAGIKNRIGWKGEFRYGLLTDLRPDKKIFQYMVERYVALAYNHNKMKNNVTIEQCPRPQLSINQKNQQQLRQTLQLTSERVVVGLCPGAEFGPSKRWPPSYYAEVAKYLIEQGKQIWLFGSTKDQDVTQEIYQSLSSEQQQHCQNLAGKTSLIDAVDLLAACDTVICNDSGLMHVAAAVGCHIVAIYGSTSPKYTPPLTKKLTLVYTDISCRPCFKRECPYGHLKCLIELKPQDVIKKLS